MHRAGLRESAAAILPRFYLVASLSIISSCGSIVYSSGFKSLNSVGSISVTVG